MVSSSHSSVSQKALILLQKQTEGEARTKEGRGPGSVFALPLETIDKIWSTAILIWMEQRWWCGISRLGRTGDRFGDFL